MATQQGEGSTPPEATPSTTPPPEAANYHRLNAAMRRLRVLADEAEFTATVLEEARAEANSNRRRSFPSACALSDMRKVEEWCCESAQELHKVAGVYRARAVSLAGLLAAAEEGGAQ